MSTGAPPRRMMPNGRMGTRIHLTFDLDAGFLMDAHASGYHGLMEILEPQAESRKPVRVAGVVLNARLLRR